VDEHLRKAIQFNLQLTLDVAELRRESRRFIQVKYKREKD